MEKLELTASELMEELHWKKSKVYYWLNMKKFETIETPEGLKAVITREQLEKYKDSESLEIPKNSEIVQNECENFQTIPNNSEKVVTKNYETFSKSLENSQIEVLGKAIEALKFALENNGNQTKLLTDSENTVKNKYFELNANYQTLEIKYNDLLEKFKTLQNENLKLSQKISEYEKSWFKKLFTKEKQGD